MEDLAFDREAARRRADAFARWSRVRSGQGHYDSSTAAESAPCHHARAAERGGAAAAATGGRPEFGHQLETAFQSDPARAGADSELERSVASCAAGSEPRSLRGWCRTQSLASRCRLRRIRESQPTLGD